MGAASRAVRRSAIPAWRWLLPACALALLAGLAVVPRVGAATEVHLVAAGDFGARPAVRSVLDEMADQQPDAALVLGDLAYQDVATETDWCAYVKQSTGEGFPFELLSGNHDSLDVHDGDINDFSSCLPNQLPGIIGTYGREYYMDIPRGAPLVRVIMTSPGLTFEDGRWDYAAGDPHYAWLEAAIDGGRARGAQWIVVGAHIPCVSVGQYSCPTNRDFYNLLLSKKVDLVLHGHEHGYMRTHQLRTGVTGCSALVVGSVDSDCIADTDNSFVAGQGTVFATVGTGGTPLRDVNAADTEAGYFAAFSGLNRTATYGLLDIAVTDTALTASFVPTSGAGFTDSFQLTAGPPPANVAPTARFTSATSALTASVDGSTSTDSDGTIAAYAWDFGDGGTATGATASHAYAAAGTYPVELTVTDDDGAVGIVQHDVTVVAAPTATAEDHFARTVSSGWGTAETGGSWTVSPSTAFSVTGGRGLISNTTGATRTATLRSVSRTSTDLVMTLSPDKLTTGGGLYANGIGRWVSGGGEYRAKLVLRSDGRAALSLVRTTATGAETTIASSVVVPNLTYAAGTSVKLRLQVTGTSPTTIRARAWSAASEPSTWQVSTTDSTAALQAPGGVGIAGYLSSSATNAPITLAVDDLVATVPAG